MDVNGKHYFSSDFIFTSIHQTIGPELAEGGGSSSQFSDDSELFSQWRRVGNAEGLKTDTEIARFLIQQYDSRGGIEKVSSIPAGGNECPQCHSALAMVCLNPNCLLSIPQTLSTSDATKSGIAIPVTETISDATKSGMAIPVTETQHCARFQGLDDADNDSVASDFDLQDDSATTEVVEEDQPKTQTPVTNSDPRTEDCSKTHIPANDSTEDHSKTQIPVQDSVPFPWVNSDSEHDIQEFEHYRKVGKIYVCKTCNREFKKKGHMDEHLLVHSDNKPHVCVICEKGYKRFQSLLTHLTKSHKIAHYECKVCNQKFLTHRELAAHKADANCTHNKSQGNDVEALSETSTRAQQTNGMVENSQSKGLLESSESSKLHIDAQPNQDNLKAAGTENLLLSCGNQSEDLTATEKEDSQRDDSQVLHEESGKHLLMGECRELRIVLRRSELGPKASTRTGINTKLSTDESNKQYVCTICSKRFKTKVALASHGLVHTDNRPFTCEICKRRFKSEASKCRHKAKYHGVLKHQCEVCNKGFATPAELAEHKSEETNCEGPASSLVGSIAECSALDDDSDGAERFETDPQVDRGASKSETGGNASAGDEAGVESLEKKSENESQVGSSTATTAQDKQHKCEECSKVFKSMQDLKSHLLSHTDEKPYSCEICMKNFKKPTTLHKHKLQFHQISKYQCKVCQKNLRTRKDLVHHKATNPNCMPKIVISKPSKDRSKMPKCESKKHICPVCGKAFQHRSSLLEHEMIHSDSRPFVCEVCGKAHRRLSSLTKHFKIHDGSTYRCTVCKEELSTEYLLKKHRESHFPRTQPVIYQCKQCGLVLATRGKLEYHIQSVHVIGKEFPCKYCGEKYSSKAERRAHMESTTCGRNMIHVCPHCNKRFEKKDFYNNHLKIHAGVLPYACEYCSKRCRSRTELKTHLRTHIEVPYSCYICKEEFSTREAMRAHRSLHKPRNCPFCSKPYYQLEQHILVRHEKVKL